MAYNRRRPVWKNYPDTSTPILAEDLNYIEDGVVSAASVADTALTTATTAASRAADAETSANSAAASATAAADSASAAAALAAAPPDAAVATALTTPGTQSSAVLADYAKAGTDSTQRLMTRLKNESQDASILFIGDSTGNETSEWIYRLTSKVAADWPTWTVQYRLWNDTSLTYDAAVTVQTGTGSRVLTVFNCSFPGATTTYYQGAKFAPAIGSLAPLLTLLTLGHNEGSIPELWHSQYASFVEQVAEALPGSDVIIVAQNPATSYTYQAPRAEVYREIAAKRGYGFIDVHQAFLDYGTWSSLLVDGIHPNPTGSELWANTVKKAFTLDGKRSPRTQGPSTLTETGAQVAVNGDFADFAGAVPTGWIANSVTLSKDTTNYESPNGYSLKITSTIAGGYLYQIAPTKAVAGRWVTLAARVRVAAGQTSGAGRISIADSIGSTTSNADGYGRDGFRWVQVTRYIDPAATNVRILLYGNSSTAGGEASFDQVVVTYGKFARRAANGSRGLTGPAGVVAGQIDFMSTFGGYGAFLRASELSSSCSIANQAILVEFRPFRDVVVNSLVWFSGATSSGNYDIGILDGAGNRLWSKGSTPWPTASTRVAETVSPTVALTAGTLYYLTFASDATTGQFRGITESFTDHIKSVTGNYLSKSVATSFPIPASLTVGNTRAGRYPAISVHGV